MRVSLSIIFLVVLSLFQIFHAQASGGNYSIPMYWLSPCGGRANFLSTNVLTAYSVNNAFKGMVGPLYIDFPSIFARYPPNGSVMKNATIECNSSDGNFLYNTTLYSNASGSWNIVNIKETPGHIYSYKHNISLSDDYYWYCEVCDVFGLCVESPVWVIYYNISPVYVYLLTPPDGYISLPTTLNLSCRAESNASLDTITLIVWKNNSVFYTQSVSASGNNFTANFSLSVDTGNYTWNCIANNSDGYESNAPSNFSFRIVPAVYPVIIEAWARPPVIVNGSNEILYIRALNADNVYANITLPNGSIVRVNLINGANVTFSNTSLTGRYNVTFIAENTTNHLYSTATDFFLAYPPVNFTLHIVFLNYILNQLTKIL